MSFKIVLFACVASVCQAAGILAPVAYGGYPYNNYPAQPAIATHQSNILRSPFNLGQISTYSKAIDTPFSSVRKSDVRVSNPGIAVGGLGLASAYHGLPAYHGLATPAIHGLPVTTAYHGAVAAPLVSHVGVSPYAAPVAKVATAGGLLGVAYSAAPAVSHMTYSNGLGLTYAW
ncbi:pupal cuticle protein C1B-like [Cydia fagiglandana]|uniref:pupal cuticle protein C1B-like n=1 Tax=Cydia fagiglandana TaxID=1458189 RepID=UPI002FEE3B98